jgi:hypothetical protein
MPLSNADLATLKAAIAAETAPAFVTYRNDGAVSLMAAFYNVDASPAQKAWASFADRKTIDEAADYSTFDGIVAGKRDAWRLFIEGAPRDFSRQKNRKLVTDVWGNATDGSVAEAVLQAATRNITRAEKLLGGSTSATTGTVSALRLTWEGPLGAGDVVDALAFGT